MSAKAQKGTHAEPVRLAAVGEGVLDAVPDGLPSGHRVVPQRRAGWTAGVVMSSRIVRFGLVAVVAAVVVVLVLDLRPSSKSRAQVTTGPHVVSSSAPNPIPATTPGKLAYGLNGHIYLANWDGSHPVRIANGGGEGHIWSPDGRYLAYWGGAGKGASYSGTVTISDARGHLVASFPGEGWQIAWSPDSKRVATWVRLGRTIGVYGLDGVRQKLLTVPPGLQPGDFDPVWSPDGASLVAPFGGEIPLDGSTPRQLPGGDPRSHWFVRHSPDGAHVAYSDGYSLHVAAADGSHARVLVPGEVDDAIWSPAGDRIAFSSSNELRVVDVASGKVTSLTALGSAGHIISFSPDGNRILFSRTNSRDVGSLWTIQIDGSEVQRLVTGTDWGEWQPLSPAR